MPNACFEIDSLHNVDVGLPDIQNFRERIIVEYKKLKGRDVDGMSK
jgi:hypothetical protein